MDNTHFIVQNEIKTNIYWNDRHIRDMYLNHNNNDSNEKTYRILDGPPFATGTPHYGHLLAGVIKDTWTRYKTYQGYKVNKNIGYDCHGVPMEMAVNKKLKISSKKDVEILGIEKYDEECRNSVLTCAKDWYDVNNRFARWGLFEKPYTTMSKDYMNKVWNMFGILYQNNMIKQGYRVCPYSTALETPLSNFESSQNYQLRCDNTLTFCVKLINFKNKINKYNDKNHYIAIFTTTPWTLFGNCAVAINKNAKYKPIVNDNNVVFYVINNNEEVNEEYIMGNELIGLNYEPIFDFTNDFFEIKPDNFYKIWHGDFVTSDVGTGAVHIAPMFGEDDYNLCLNNKIIDKFGKNLHNYLNSKGEIDPNIGRIFDENYTLTNCIQCNNKIIKYIEKNKSTNFISTKQMSHSYPHCERSGTPLIYLACTTWTVTVTDIKDELVELNKDINWYPDHVGKKRFNDWLLNVKDWNISRSRFWGTPIPVWKEIEGTDLIIVNSSFELEHLCGLKSDSIQDMHRSIIDKLIIEKNGKKYKRIDDVLDCWFESGCVPFYFSNNDEYIPADLIAEGLDQTRGWFYTLLVLGCICSKALNKKMDVAYKNVIVNGLVLAKDGKKMSKSLKNYSDPMDIINKYGADSLRLYLMSSPASKCEDLRFDDNGVQNQLGNILIPYYNTLKFVNEYVLLHNDYLSDFKNMGYINVETLKHPLNLWIYNEMTVLEKIIFKNYDEFQGGNIVAQLHRFTDVLNNQYLKLNRKNIKNQNRDDDINEITIESIHVTVFIILRLAYIMAPIAPYFAEYLYQFSNPIINKSTNSIHLQKYSDFYKFNTIITDKQKEIIDFIEIEFKLLGHVRNLRSELKLSQTKILKHAHYYLQNYDLFQKYNFLSEEFVDEMNIMDVSFYKLDDDNMKNIKLIPIIDRKLLFNKYKINGNKINNMIMNLTDYELLHLKNNNKILKDENVIESDIILEWKYKLLNDNKFPKNMDYSVGSNYILFLDTTNDQTMIDRYNVKMLARKFQKMRKEAKLRPWDPVNLTIKFTSDNNLLQVLKNDDYQKLFFDITNRHINIKYNKNENENENETKNENETENNKKNILIDTYKCVNENAEYKIILEMN
jgi:isoleucyl-tRNA synthetase